MSNPFLALKQKHQVSAIVYLVCIWFGEIIFDDG